MTTWVARTVPRPFSGRGGRSAGAIPFRLGEQRHRLAALRGAQGGVTVQLLQRGPQDAERSGVACADLGEDQAIRCRDLPPALSDTPLRCRSIGRGSWRRLVNRVREAAALLLAPRRA